MDDPGFCCDDTDLDPFDGRRTRQPHVEEDSVWDSTIDVVDVDRNIAVPSSPYPPVRYSLPELLYRRQSFGNNNSNLNSKLSLASIGRRSFPPHRIPSLTATASVSPDHDVSDDDDNNREYNPQGCRNAGDEKGPARPTPSSSVSSSSSDQEQQSQSFQPVPLPYLSYRGAW